MRPVRAIPPAPSPRPPPAKRLILIRGIRRRPSDGASEAAPYAHAMSETARFQQRTASVGMKVDVTDIADTFELLDSYDTETAR